MDYREIIKQMQQMREQTEKIDLLQSFPLVNDKRADADILLSASTKAHEDTHNAMNLWLDYLLDVFNAQRFAEGTFFSNLTDAQEKSDLWALTCRWVHSVRQAQQNGKSLDFFGETYEEIFKSKGKAQALGQFFTPMSISRLMAEISRGEGKHVVSDCCCGSGRLPLGMYEVWKDSIDNDTDFHFFVCGDLDMMSVKMCALNLMIHGIHGIVVSQDALLLSKPNYGYFVNPTDAPIRMGMLSVQYLDADMCSQYVDWQDEELHSNLSNLIAKEEYMWNLAHEKYEKPKPTKPIQLSLFD